MEIICGGVKYLLFVSREIWPAFNSLYAYTKLKENFPREIVLLYTDEDVAKSVEIKIKKLYEVNQKELVLRKRKIGSSISSTRKMLLDMVEDGDVVDITGARKTMILSLVGVENIKITYLFLQDMRFANYPFMKRPLSLQKLMEVSQ